MLQSLKHLSREEAERVLASFAKTLLPTPEEKPPYFADSSLSQNLLRELSTRANITNVRNPAEYRGRLFSVLAEELGAYALQSSNLDAVKARLGARGDLRSDFYKIEMPPVVKEFQRCGIRPSHIENAIRQPTSVEHLSQPSPEL